MFARCRFTNVAFPCGRTPITKRIVAEIVNARLDDVGPRRPATAFHRAVRGMRKRAGSREARARTECLFDEPDSGLDPVARAALRLIKRCTRRRGNYVSSPTTSPPHGRSAIHRVLWKGASFKSGDAKSMFESSNPFVRQFLNRDVTGPLGME